MSVSTVSARHLAAASLAAAAVIGAVALPASAADHPRPDRTRVEISSVQYDSPGRDNRSNRSLNKEWVELTNTTRHGVNLDGWTLADEHGRTYTFDHYRLDGRATVRIHTGVGRDTRTDLFQDRRHHVWDNHAGTATLRNDRGRFIDDASWGNDRHRSDRSDRHHSDRSSHGRHHGDSSDHGRHHGDRSERGGHHHGDRSHG
ncbi:lamin tail domain-containing protein [Streptomyces sp. NPDC058676]|uniref:lamin tail domain-containing protein n=1 Tax=unclassified Streptomyces TaxID=2593676 RepID=UPI003669325B